MPKTMNDLKSTIKETIEVDENAKIILKFKENEEYIILTDMEDLKDGMTIKVSLSLSQSQSQSLLRPLPQQHPKIDGFSFSFSFFFSFIFILSAPFFFF